MQKLQTNVATTLTEETRNLIIHDRLFATALKAKRRIGEKRKKEIRLIRWEENNNIKLNNFLFQRWLKKIKEETSQLCNIVLINLDFEKKDFYLEARWTDLDGQKLNKKFDL